MLQRKLSIFQIQTKLKKSEILGARLGAPSTRRSLSVSVGVFLVLLGSLTAVAVDNNPTDLIDDNLNVALAPAGDMFFPDTGAEITETMAEINFDSATSGFGIGAGIQAVLLDNNTSTRTIGTGSGTLQFGDFNRWGGAGGVGRYAVPGVAEANNYTLRFINNQGATFTQRYVGFWWSAGNGDNNLQLLDQSGAVISGFTTFTTASVLRTIFPNNPNGNNLCPGTRPTAAQITANSGLAYCGNPTLNNDGTFRFEYVNEPFAFIHFRYADGFGGIKIWGDGFEFDNLTFSETNPAGAVGEVAIGGGLNTTCTGVGALQNGGFETPNIGNTFLIRNDASFSGDSDGIRWLTTASDHQLEFWRSGFQSVPSGEGNQFAELNANQFAGLYQDIETVSGTVIRWSLQHRGRDGTESIRVLIGATTGSTTYTSSTGATYSVPGTFTPATGVSATKAGITTNNVEDGTGAWGTWTGSYTVPAGQATTRFLFISFNPGASNNSSGNFLDDIQFTPTLACPDEASIIVGRSAVSFSPITNDFRPNTGNTITVVSTTGVGTATVSGTNLQLSSSTVGSFTVRYRLTNSFGDTSQANAVITVLSESTPRLPDVLLVDPRLNSVDFPQAIFENATNLLVCVQESDSGGTILNSPTVSFDVASKDSTETAGIGSATISGDRTSTLLIRHTRQNVLDTFNSQGGLRAYLSSGNFTSTKYVRVRTLPVATSTTAVTSATCADAVAAASKTIEIRPLGLTKTLRKGTIQLK